MFVGTPEHTSKARLDAHAAVALASHWVVPTSCPDSSRGIAAEEREGDPGKTRMVHAGRAGNDETSGYAGLPAAIDTASRVDSPVIVRADARNIGRSS